MLIKMKGQGESGKKNRCREKAPTDVNWVRGAHLYPNQSCDDIHSGYAFSGTRGMFKGAMGRSGRMSPRHSSSHSF